MWRRRLNQRERGRLAKLPQSTIDPVESGAVVLPRFDTIEATLHSTGYAPAGERLLTVWRGQLR